ERRDRRRPSDEFASAPTSVVAIGATTTKEPTMPELDAVETGNPCWIDIMTSDPAATTAFYTELLGWEADEPSAEHGGYINFTKDGSRIAGAMASQEAGQPDVWSVYIAVDDAAATVAAVEAA